MRYFVVLARHRHFGRAAAELNIAQPGLSQQIKVLEQKLKASLLNRGPQGVTLTPAGRALLEGAEPLLTAADELGERVRAVAEGTHGKLRLAYSRSGADDLITAVIRRFRKDHEDVRVSVTTGMSSWCLRLLRDGDLDAAFVRGVISEPGITSVVVAEAEAAVVLPADHPLATRDRLTRRDLRDLPVVLWPREAGPTLYKELVADVWPDGPPRLVSEEPDFEQVVASVAEGTGISVMDLGRARKLRPPEVAVRRFVEDEPAGPPRYAVSFVHRTDDPNPVLARFAAYVAQPDGSCGAARLTPKPLGQSTGSAQAGRAGTASGSSAAYEYVGGSPAHERATRGMTFFRHHWSATGPCGTPPDARG
ncbi:LysR family transcriptional regulator [Streptomyces sp. NPDC020379]|uniref:LysR family transcriptional regulator n=1 Tax=Streptomyces sp. NPDC020379 TaxID=3365071 RepID=UPI003794863B